MKKSHEFFSYIVVFIPFGAILKPRGENLGYFDPLSPHVVIFISEPYLLMCFFGGPPFPPYCPRGLRMTPFQESNSDQEKCLLCFPPSFQMLFAALKSKSNF